MLSGTGFLCAIPFFGRLIRREVDDVSGMIKRQSRLFFMRRENEIGTCQDDARPALDLSEQTFERFGVAGSYLQQVACFAGDCVALENLGAGGNLCEKLRVVR